MELWIKRGKKREQVILQANDKAILKQKQRWSYDYYASQSQFLRNSIMISTQIVHLLLFAWIIQRKSQIYASTCK